jgi:hypothetical protein
MLLRISSEEAETLKVLENYCFLCRVKSFYASLTLNALLLIGLVHLNVIFWIDALRDLLRKESRNLRFVENLDLEEISSLLSVGIMEISYLLELG